MTLERPSGFAAGDAGAHAGLPVPKSTQFGSGLLLGSAAGLLGTLPAAVRVAETGASLLLAWITLAGAASVLLAPAVVAARVVRPFPAGLVHVAFGIGLAFGPLVLFAGALWAGTHHRPLGAVTFSLLSSALLVGCILVAARLRSARVAGGRVGSWLLWLGCLLSLALGLSKLPSALQDAGFGAGLLDALALLILAGLSVRFRVSAGLNRIFRVAGPITYSLLGVSAAALLRGPELYAALTQKAPVPLGPLVWLFAG